MVQEIYTTFAGLVRAYLSKGSTSSGMLPWPRAPASVAAHLLSSSLSSSLPGCTSNVIFLSTLPLAF